MFTADQINAVGDYDYTRPFVTCFNTFLKSLHFIKWHSSLDYIHCSELQIFSTFNKNISPYFI